MGTYQDIYSLCLVGNNIFAGTGNCLYFSTNDGLNWNETALNYQKVYSFAINGSNIFVGTEFNGIYRSTNNGMNWEQVYNYDNWIVDLKIIGNSIFAGTAGMGIIKSTNNGMNWVQSGLSNVNVVYKFATINNNIFAGVMGGIYISSDNGTNWSLTGIDSLCVYNFALNGFKFFAGTINGLFISSNNGTNWIETSFYNQNVVSLYVYGNNIIAGIYNSYESNGGVYLTTNNGLNWIEKNQGFNQIPTPRTFLIKDNYIYVGTYSHSVWRRPLSEIIGIKPISEIVPDRYSLSQNYPNPFNPATKIKFDIPALSSPLGRGAGGMCVLKVFDILGKEIETLVNEKLNPGTYEVTFNASQYPSGVYFYRLITDNFTDTKRMILLK